MLAILIFSTDLNSWSILVFETNSVLFFALLKCHVLLNELEYCVLKIVFCFAGFVEPLRGAVMDASLSSIKQDHLGPWCTSFVSNLRVGFIANINRRPDRRG